MKSLELAIKAGRSRQSAQTRLVHHSYEFPESPLETIPLYENFCFALALFRSKSAENILEAKTLLKHLFAFQIGQSFPVYLHEFPECKSSKLSYKLSIIAQFLLRDFKTVLGDDLRLQLEQLIQPFEATSDKADFLIQSQLTGDDPTPILKQWDGKALCSIEPYRHDRGEPAVTLLDLIMGEWTDNWSSRALRDQPLHLQASLIYPPLTPIPTYSSIPRWGYRSWGTGHPTHSALLQVEGNYVEEGDRVVINLPAKEVHDSTEVSYFINRFPEAQFFVHGHKATTFLLNQPILIESGGLAFEMTFSILEGDGKFWGHLHLGNRPGQIGCRGTFKHEAFDRSIALRTVHRTQAVRLQLTFKQLEPARL